MSDLIFMPSYSIQPSKIVTFNRVFKKVRNIEEPVIDFVSPVKKQDRIISITSKNVIKRRSHNLKISDNAYRTLKKRINWLYYLSKSKTVKTKHGKTIYNFKVGFHTFTLPSRQKTPTSEVTNKIFNHFLTLVRQQFEMVNYVWRLEFQKNGNVHYHLVSDCYFDYFDLRRLWNSVLELHGYIDDYQSKFKDLSLHEYNNLTNASKKVDFNVIAKRYALGKKNNWRQPNTVDSRSVISNKSIASYLAKYFAKDSKHNVISNDLDNEENTKNMRLWFCSRSLSRLNTFTGFMEELEVDIFSLINSLSKVRKFVGRYATVYYFDFKDFAAFGRKTLEMLLRGYAKSCKYVPT